MTMARYVYAVETKHTTIALGPGKFVSTLLYERWVSCGTIIRISRMYSTILAQLLQHGI